MVLSRYNDQFLTPCKCPSVMSPVLAQLQFLLQVFVTNAGLKYVPYKYYIYIIYQRVAQIDHDLFMNQVLSVMSPVLAQLQFLLQVLVTNAGLKYVPCNRFIKKAEYLGIKINHNLSILLRCCEQNISHKKSIKKQNCVNKKSTVE